MQSYYFLIMIVRLPGVVTINFIIDAWIDYSHQSFSFHDCLLWLQSNDALSTGAS